jgi:hypothetical protein
MWLNSESQNYASWLGLLELHSRNCEALLITDTHVSFILLGFIEVSCLFQSMGVVFYVLVYGTLLFDG